MHNTSFFLKRFVLHQKLILCILITFFLIYISWIYYQKAVLFSFVDEFNNYVSAYYMLQGKVLYKDIFFNHQMLMPYISYGLQIVLTPENIYQYVLYHRLFVIVFSSIMGIILTYRFGYIGFVFVVLYELTKYYCFGNLFLAESLIVYPIVYLFGLSWMKLNSKKISPIDIILSGFFTSFIVFLREPFIPVSILLFSMILWKRKMHTVEYSTLIMMLGFFVTLILTLPIKEYIYQIGSVNFNTVASYEVKTNNLAGFGIVKLFLYPFDIFLEGKQTHFRIILVIIDILFFLFISLYVYLFKKIKNVLYIFVILGMCAIRFVLPGTQFYEAYRQLPWYGLFIICTLLLIHDVTSRIYKKSLRYSIVGILWIIMITTVLLPQSFLWESVNREVDFHRNYGQYTGPGDVMKSLANDDDTLFIEGWDSMIYLDAKIPPAYPYIYYYPIMTGISKYSQLKDTMFRKNSPDFYYICYNKNATIPELIKKYYEELLYKGISTCIYIKREKIQEISTSKLTQIKQQGYIFDE